MSVIACFIEIHIWMFVNTILRQFQINEGLGKKLVTSFINEKFINEKF